MINEMHGSPPSITPKWETSLVYALAAIGDLAKTVQAILKKKYDLA